MKGGVAKEKVPTYYTMIYAVPCIRTRCVIIRVLPTGFFKLLVTLKKSAKMEVLLHHLRRGRTNNPKKSLLKTQCVT